MRTFVLLLGLNAVCFAISPAEENEIKESAREYIKDHLKAPATAVFSKETICAPVGKADFEEAKGTGPTPECKPQTAEKLGDGAEAVVYRAAVDAQNSYGALIRTKFQLRIAFAGGKLVILDIADTVRELKEGCRQLNEYARRNNKPLRNCNAEFPSAK